jgi:hypothetical protein
MPDGLNKVDQLAFVRRERLVSRCHWPAEAGNGVFVLDEDRPKTMRRRVTLHDEGFGEVRQCQHRC